MIVTYDRQARATYVRIREGATVARTEQLDARCLVDYGADGRVLGIEILNADEPVITDITRIVCHRHVGRDPHCAVCNP